MSIAIDEFWKRAVAKALITPDRCRQLHKEFAAQTQGSPAGAKRLAQWLITNGILTREQASMLLTQPGDRAATPDRTAPSANQASARPTPPRGSASGGSPRQPKPEVSLGPPADGDNLGLPESFSPLPRRRPKRWLPALASGCVALALVAAILIAGMVLSDRDQAKVEPTRTPGVDRENQTQATSAVERDQQKENDVAAASASPAGEVDDDGQTLWVSPTVGQPPSLEYVPPGTQVLLIVRLADLLQNAEGARLIDALGPSGHQAVEDLRTVLGVELADVDQLLVAFQADDMGLPRAIYVTRLRQPVSETSPPKSWGPLESRRHGAKSFLQGSRFAYYLPGDAQGRVVAIASAAAMKQILELDGPPPLRQGIERLLRHADAARHFNLLAAPNYLWTDGKDLLIGPLAKLREPLARTFDESFEAVLASAHLGDDLFLELRAAIQADKDAGQQAQLLARRLAGAADELEQHLATFQPHPHGRLVVNRLPRMLQLLSDYTRSGAEDRQVVLDAYLPLAAAHNLMLGCRLVLAENPVAASVVAVPPSTTAPARAPAALQKRISLSFPRDTLERCLDMLSKEIDVQIVILGPDLQLEGITKNQSFSLDERDQPAGEVLRKVLKLANPDGKLVYVIRPGAGEGESIFITTRSAAMKRHEKLPDGP